MIFVFLKKFNAYNKSKEGRCKFTTFLFNNQIFSSNKTNIFVSALLLATCVVTQLIKNIINKLSVLINYYLTRLLQINQPNKYLACWILNNNEIPSIFRINKVVFQQTITIPQFFNQKSYQKIINANLSRLFSFFPFESASRSVVTMLLYQKGRDEFYSVLSRNNQQKIMMFKKIIVVETPHRVHSVFDYTKVLLE